MSWRITRRSVLASGAVAGLGGAAEIVSIPIPHDCTDGLTEAANSEGEELGVERLIDYFNNSSPKSTKDFVHQALTCVAKFTGCTNQADDICMLGISYSEHEAKPGH